MYGEWEVKAEVMEKTEEEWEWEWVGDETKAREEEEKEEGGDGEIIGADAMENERKVRGGRGGRRCRVTGGWGEGRGGGRYGERVDGDKEEGRRKEGSCCFER